MDYMNECKSSIYRSLDNICSCMLDENTNEEISSVFRDLVLEGGYQNSSIMTTLESICNDRGKNIGFGSSVINTYPFGQITNETHNLFLGICAGKTTFLSLMKAVNTYCGRAYMNHGEKQVVVLTTQWNPVIFSRFEPVFLDYALHHEFRFLFFLVNEYGAARIPFFD